MMTNDDWIKNEKEEADIHWDYVFNQSMNGNVDRNLISLAMKRVNEIDLIILKGNSNDQYSGN